MFDWDGELYPISEPQTRALIDKAEAGLLILYLQQFTTISTPSSTAVSPR